MRDSLLARPIAEIVDLLLAEREKNKITSQEAMKLVDQTMNMKNRHHKEIQDLMIMLHKQDGALIAYECTIATLTGKPFAHKPEST